MAEGESERWEHFLGNAPLSRCKGFHLCCTQWGGPREVFTDSGDEEDEDQDEEEDDE